MTATRSIRDIANSPRKRDSMRLRLLVRDFPDGTSMTKPTESSVSGTLEIEPRGGGFLRNHAANYAVSPKDAHVPPELVKAEHLTGGEFIEALAKPDPRRPGGLRVSRIERVCGQPAVDFAAHTEFGELTVVDPREPIRLSTIDGPGTTRVIDLM